MAGRLYTRCLSAYQTWLSARRSLRSLATSLRSAASSGRCPAAALGALAARQGSANAPGVPAAAFPGSSRLSASRRRHILLGRC
jgi:hypothetical protein